MDKNQDITLGLPPPTVHSLIPVYTGYPDNSAMLRVCTGLELLKRGSSSHVVGLKSGFGVGV